jgi:hypothetical protein
MVCRVAVVEDCEVASKIIREVMEGHTLFDLVFFKAPHVLIATGQDGFDLILSDWCFGNVELNFYEKVLDVNKLIILSGSVIPREFKCLGVLSKLGHIAKLPEVLKEYYDNICELRPSECA